MCDESIDADATPDRGDALSRRAFTALAGATALVGSAGGAATRRGLSQATVRIRTPDGIADAFYLRPARGVHPGVVLWPDIGGLREVFKDMARRLADGGYAVLAVNQYYRSSPAPVLDSFAQWRTPEGQARLKPMIAAITPAGTLRDATAFVGFLDAQGAVDKRRRIATNGYCMGGPFAVRTAAAVPHRVAAVASLHGANLVSDDPDSPVRLIARSDAAFLFAIGRNDDARAPGDKDALRIAAVAAHRHAEVEVYPADHGWCVADSPVYDKVAAEHAWQRMLALFARV